MQNESLSFEQRWKKRFEKFARNNTEASIAGWSESGLSTRVGAFKRQWSKLEDTICPDGLWCDIGCGAGTYINLLHNFKQQVVGVDYSLPTLQAAQKWVSKQPHWGQVDVQSLAFIDHCFDGLLCFGVLQALTMPSRAIKECHRVLKIDGLFWVDALNNECILHRTSQLWRRLKKKPKHLHYLYAKDVIEIMQGYGFSDIQLHYLLILPQKLYFFQKWLDASGLTWFVQKTPIINRLLCHSFMIHAKKRSS